MATILEMREKKEEHGGDLFKILAGIGLAIAGAAMLNPPAAAAGAGLAAGGAGAAGAGAALGGATAGLGGGLGVAGPAIGSAVGSGLGAVATGASKIPALLTMALGASQAGSGVGDWYGKDQAYKAATSMGAGGVQHRNIIPALQQMSERYRMQRGGW